MNLSFQFESLGDFFAMGNYGFYVWLSYGVSIAAMIGLIIYSRREQQQILNKAKREVQREAQQKK